METQPIAGSARGLRHVFLRDLVLPASIGVHPHEHAAPQRVRINVDLGVRGRRRAPAVARSRSGATSCRAWWTTRELADTVRGIVAAGHVRLVETLAERIAEACLADRAGAPRAGPGGEARYLRGCGVGGGGDRTPAARLVHVR